MKPVRLERIKDHMTVRAYEIYSDALIDHVDDQLFWPTLEAVSPVRGNMIIRLRRDA